MTEKLCRNCAHWRLEELLGISSGPTFSGECASEKLVYSEALREDSRAMQLDHLVYWDSEGYSAGMNTGPNFGCVHWKAK
jgi:hypothetical protein